LCVDLATLFRPVRFDSLKWRGIIGLSKNMTGIYRPDGGEIISMSDLFVFILLACSSHGIRPLRLDVIRTVLFVDLTWQKIFFVVDYQ